MTRIEDKNCIVTGAGSGIGRALCLELTRQGAHVIGTDIDEKGLQETRLIVGKKMSTYICDASDRSAVFEFRDAVIEKHKHIDILINNAGVVLASTPFVDTKQEDWDWLMKVNFNSVLYHCQAFIPHLLDRPEANISNVSSLFGLMGVDEQSPYCTSKFAVRGLSESLHMEYLDTNLCISSIHPGGIKTNIVRNSRNENTTDREKEALFFEEKLAKNTAEYAAKTIIKGIRNKKARILVGSDAKNTDRLIRWIPNSRIKLFHKAIAFIKSKK